jgi:CheY-like chemotaxis protein
MVDISRITRGALSVERAPVEIAEAVRRAVETAAPLIEAAKHKLELDLPPQGMIVDGDLGRLTQLLTNLLNNAARYTPAGGRIAVTARVEGGNALVRVRDNGRGIERQMLERIFDMFVQGRALLRVEGGLGVGLALARRTAELHGGSLEAHSEGAGKGSEFTLRLPLASRQAVSAAEQVTMVQPVVAQRVLVVDDNADAAATLELLLKSLGHETRVAHDGFEALRVAPRFRPDIVLLDIGMPGLDGYEVARRLRSLERERPFRIVAITGWGQEADRQKSREAGFDVHLVKPVEPKELARVLHGKNGGATLH